MTAELHITLYCDGPKIAPELDTLNCENYYPSDYKNKKNARKQAKREGWTQLDKFDVCPECLKLLINKYKKSKNRQNTSLPFGLDGMLITSKSE